MDEESLNRICTTAFSEEDILCAKNQLYESISTTRRKKLRIRQVRSQRDIEHIVCVSKEIDLEDIPIFVARDLHKLAPVLFDHVDVTRLLKYILRMKDEIKLIRDEYVTVKKLNELKSYLELLIVDNFSPDRIANKRREAALLQSFEYDSGPIGLEHFNIQVKQCIAPRQNVNR